MVFQKSVNDFFSSGCILPNILQLDNNTCPAQLFVMILPQLELLTAFPLIIFGFLIF